MRRHPFLAIILIAALALQLGACAAQEEEPVEEPTSSSEESSEASESQEDAPPEPEPEEEEPPEEEPEEPSQPPEPQPEPSSAAEAASSVEAGQQAAAQQPAGFPAASTSGTNLSPDDVTIYVQDLGQHTLSDFTNEQDKVDFVRLVNELQQNANPGGSGGADVQVGYLLVRDDYEKYQYSLSGNQLTVDNSTFVMSEEQKDKLSALAGSPVCGTYAQWLIYMRPSRVKGAYYYKSGDDSAWVVDDYDTLAERIRWVGVVRGSGSLYTPKGERPLTGDDFRIRLFFDSGVEYIATFSGSTLYLEATDISYACKYTLSNPVDVEHLRYEAEGAPIPTTPENPETGKPVIYLYPQQTQDVEVRLDFQGQLYYTYPTYQNGWRVTAQPDGTLTNKADGSTHYYLFWDGTADKKDWDMSKGFLMKGSEVEAFLKKTLPQLGLTPREYNDFITYWVPILSPRPYVLLSFSTDEYEAVAPLTVSPAPDTVWRVHMLYQFLTEPVEVEAQTLPTPPARDGFTVVEWGGTLVK